MKLTKKFPELNSKANIKREILRKLRKYQKTKPTGGEYDYMLFLDVAKKYDVNCQRFNDALFELIREKKIAMNENRFCVKREFCWFFVLGSFRNFISALNLENF